VIEATIAHAGAMEAVHGAAFPHDPWDAASFATLLAQPGVTGLIDPHGGILLLRVAADEAEIITIAVAARRRGIGTGLMRAALERAASQGATLMHLEVAADNEPALALYRALGFQPAGRRKRYYPNGADAVLLSRTV
jgi:ribosomal-protein-alanine N-acetyltransferase